MNYATRDVVTVSPADSIDKAISLMEERNIHHLVVTKGQTVVGMLSDRDILVSTGWMLSVERQARLAGSHEKKIFGPTRIEQIMSQPAICLDNDHSTRDVGSLMLTRKISAIPILNQGRLVGLLTETDLVKWAPLDETAADRLLDGAVMGLMRTHVLSVTPGAPLDCVIHLFRSRRIRHAPVVSEQRLVGIISDRDIRRALGWGRVREMQAECEGRLAEVDPPRFAADIMHEGVHTVGPSTSLRDALRNMLADRIHSLPVVEAQTLQGIITLTDFVRAFMRLDMY